MKFYDLLSSVKDRTILRKIFAVCVPLLTALVLVWLTFRRYYNPAMKTKWFAIGMLAAITSLLALSAFLLYRLWRWAWMENTQLNRLYLHDIVKAQEDIRASLAREIHDGPLQDITALIQRLRLISLSQSQEEAEKRLTEAKNVSMDVVHQLREVCNNLTPPWLELGLRQSLIELADRRSRLYGITIYTAGIEDVDLSEDQTLAFFRIAQQALANAAQHAEADKISLRLFENDGTVCMEIEDNGRGFDVPENLKIVRTTGHRGLSNMYERMRLIGGECRIVSTPGCGTTIICTLKK